jgi:DNA-binding response OmpR family regulator
MARVLLVDDEAAAIEIRKLLLERAGHQVSTAATADAARSAARCEVVILDLRLPRLEDGLALIREFHAAGVRVIVLSGNRADLDGCAEALLCDQILTKPARSEMLLKAIG